MRLHGYLGHCDLGCKGPTKVHFCVRPNEVYLELGPSCVSLVVFPLKPALKWALSEFQKIGIYFPSTQVLAYSSTLKQRIQPNWDLILDGLYF